MLAFLVIANVNVALKGSTVQGLEFGKWYYWLRLLFQPIFMIWALFVSGAIWRKEASNSLSLHLLIHHQGAATVELHDSFGRDGFVSDRSRRKRDSK